MNENFSFGYWLKRQRLACDLHQDELARQLGIATVTLRKIEADARRPSLQLIERVAAVFELSDDEHALLRRVARADLGPEALPLPTAAHGSLLPDEPGVSPAAAQQASAWPSGTVTFLFTDIEGSTRLWERAPDAMGAALARHTAILQQAIADSGGVVVKGTGGGLLAAFSAPLAALTAARVGQRALLAEGWALPEPLRVRIALHTGQATSVAGDYVGTTLNRAARLLAAGHGAQVLVSEVTAELLVDTLPSEAALIDLGSYQLKDRARREHIFQLVVPELPEAFPPLRAVDVPAGSLPPQPTPFIGRRAELGALDAVFADAAARLITITGPGGIGKSRLALAMADRQLAAGRFRDGAAFVALAPLSVPEHISATLAEALGFQLIASDRQSRTPREQIVSYLRPKQLLVILDNCEHLLDGVRALATQVLEAAPGVRLLATSRERLNLHGEQLAPLGGLSAGVDADAATLFMATAQRARPDMLFDAERQAKATRICALVGGMPLAIELAAGWVDTLSLDEIAGEIARDLGVLATDIYDMPERHRSMRAVFDATWQRLDAAEREVFARLAVFRGGCTRAALQSITGATLRQIQTLVGKSVLQHRQPRDRYAIHELLRQYAAERLAADPASEEATRERHAGYYLSDLARRAPDLKGAKQDEALDAIEAEGENIRVAWAWAAGQRQVRLLAAALEPLGLFYQWRGRFEEGLAACTAARTALSGADAPEMLLLQARALGWQSDFASLVMQIDDASRLAEQGLALLDAPLLAGVDTRPVRAFLLLRHADVIAYQSVEIAIADARASLALARESAEPWAIATAINYVATLLSFSGREADALEIYAEGVQILRGLGDQMLRAQMLSGMSKGARYCGQYSEAARYAEECLAIGTQLSIPALIALGHAHLGATVWLLGEPERALAELRESLAICTELGDPDGSAFVCNNHYRLCLVLTALGRHEEAHAMAERGLQLARQTGNTIAESGCLDQLGLFALVQGDYARAYELIHDSLRIMQAIGATGEMQGISGNLSLAEQGLGQHHAARRRLLASLRQSLASPSPLILGRLLACAAALLADDGWHERALELGALVQEEPFISGSLYCELLAAPLAKASAALASDIAADAQARGRGGALVEHAHALVEELAAASWGTANDEREHGAAL